MDLAEDVQAIEPRSPPAAARRSFRRGISYGTIWPGGAADAFFNVVWFIHGAHRAGKHRAQHL